MRKLKLIRLTTVPISLEKLLEGQLKYMQQYYEVTAIASDEKRLKAYGEKEGVSTFHLNLTRTISPFLDLKALLSLYRFLKKEQPTFVHSHTPKAGIIGMMAAYLARVPYRLHTVAGLPLLEAKGFKRFVLNTVEKLTYKFATHVYPNSQGLKDIILEHSFSSETKLKIIGKGSSNGIDIHYFSRAHFSDEELQFKRQELIIPKDDFVFIFVGRIVKDKGINELIAAFNTLQSDLNNIHELSLLLVGAFEDELDPISDFSKETIKNNKKIITTGYQEDVRVYYALSNVLVFPSYREGFPNVVMQAGAMELPCIVSNINGSNEIIQDKKNGIIIPLKDEGALLKSMKDCLLDRKQLSEYSANSREMIVSRYEQKYIWRAILNEYQQLANNY